MDDKRNLALKAPGGESRELSLCKTETGRMNHRGACESTASWTSATGLVSISPASLAQVKKAASAARRRLCLPGHVATLAQLGFPTRRCAEHEGL